MLETILQFAYRWSTFVRQCKWLAGASIDRNLSNEIISSVSLFEIYSQFRPIRGIITAKFSFLPAPGADKDRILVQCAA